MALGVKLRLTTEHFVPSNPLFLTDMRWLGRKVGPRRDRGGRNEHRCNRDTVLGAKHRVSSGELVPDEHLRGIQYGGLLNGTERGFIRRTVRSISSEEKRISNLFIDGGDETCCWRLPALAPAAHSRSSPCNFPRVSASSQMRETHVPIVPLCNAHD